MKVRNGVLIAVAAIASLALSGCAQKFYTGMKTESHLALPNANVEPLKKTTGEASSMSLIGMGMATVTPEMKRKAVKDALSKVSGANVIVNYHEFQVLTNFWLFNKLTYRIEGTAAKQVIGTQELTP